MVVRRDYLVGALLVGALALVTAARVPVWQTDLSLWTATVQASPHKPRVLENLGVSLAATDTKQARRRMIQAMQESQDVRRLWYEQVAGPISAQINLAWLLIGDHEAPAAEAMIADIEARRPDVMPAHLVGAVLASIRRDCVQTAREVATIHAYGGQAEVSCAP